MNTKLGPLISEKRKQAHLTQQDLADKLGVSNTAVSKWENDINYPDISLIQPLCKMLNIDIMKLLDIDNKPKMNIFKYLTIILTIILLSILVSLHITDNKESIYEVSRVSLDNQLYTVEGLIIKKDDTNNILIYNLVENDNGIGTTKEKTIKRINIIINNKTKHTFSDINNLLNEINHTIISTKEIINDLKLEIIYKDNTKQEYTSIISLNIDDFE